MYRGRDQSRGCVATIRCTKSSPRYSGRGALCQLKVRVLRVGRRLESVRINRGGKARAGSRRASSYSRVRPLFTSFVPVLPFNSPLPLIPRSLSQFSYLRVSVCGCVYKVSRKTRAFSSTRVQLKREEKSSDCLVAVAVEF